MEGFDVFAPFVFEVSSRGFFEFELVDGTVVVIDMDISGWSLKRSARYE
jgi:hypothetical protein